MFLMFYLANITIILFTWKFCTSNDYNKAKLLFISAQGQAIGAAIIGRRVENYFRVCKATTNLNFYCIIISLQHERVPRISKANYTANSQENKYSY